MGRVKLMHETGEVDEPMAEIVGGKHCKRNNTRRRETLRSCRAVPCAVCAVLSASPGPHQAALPMSSTRRLAVFSTPAWDTTTKRRRAASQAAAPQAATPGAAGRGQQHSRHLRISEHKHRACCEAARCCFLRGIVPAADEIEGPTQKTRRSHPCLVSRRGTWGFGSL